MLSFGEWGFTPGYPVLVKIDGDGRDSNFGRFLFRFQSHGTFGKLSTTVTILGKTNMSEPNRWVPKSVGLNVI